MHLASLVEWESYVDRLRYCSLSAEIVVVEGDDGVVVGGVQILVRNRASCCGRGSAIHEAVPEPLVRIPKRASSAAVLFDQDK